MNPVMNGGNRVPLLGRFIIICGPFQSYPIPIPAFHLSTGTLWNPFFHFRFIDQHASSYSIERMVESRSVHRHCLFDETIQPSKGSKNELCRICYAALICWRYLREMLTHSIMSHTNTVLVFSHSCDLLR